MFDLITKRNLFTENNFTTTRTRWITEKRNRLSDEKRFDKLPIEPETENVFVD